MGTDKKLLAVLEQAGSAGFLILVGRDMYESMRTDELLGLRSAHELDQAAASSEASILFGQGRIALIDDVLVKRGEAN